MNVIKFEPAYHVAVQRFNPNSTETPPSRERWGTIPHVVTVTVTGKVRCDPSSNLDEAVFIFHIARNTLQKDMNPTKGKIVGQAELFNLSIATGPRD